MKFISLHKIFNPKTFPEKLFRNVRINLPFNVKIDVYILDTIRVCYGFELNLMDFIFDINCFPLSISIWKCRY